MSSNQFIVLTQSATEPFQNAQYYTLYSDKRIVLDRGYVRSIPTGVGLAPPHTSLFKIIHIDGSNWSTIPGHIGGGEEGEIKIKLGSITSDGVTINVGDPICMLHSMDNIPATPTVSNAQIDVLRQDMLNKLSKSTIKKIV